MVPYSAVQTSNSNIATALPAGLTAVFVGGTNGIGEYTLKQFAKHTIKPRVYFIGRSQEAGERIAKECSDMNPTGAFRFIQRDTSLVRNVDVLCQELKSREKAINLLFLTTGTLDFSTNTSEDLRLAIALAHYTRARFIHNLLPELQAASSLKRVVSVFAGTKEGSLYVDGLMNPDRIPMTKARGHGASLVTIGMENLVADAPDVTFIHTFPGPVKSGIGREMPGITGTVVRTVFGIFGPLFNIPTEESGAYHLFFATSAKYPAKHNNSLQDGVPLDNDLAVARGNDGKSGSGMYCINERGESADPTVERLLQGFRDDGITEKVWKHTEDEWQRILGTSKA